MNFMLPIFHTITAILIPIGTVALAILMTVKIQKSVGGKAPNDDTVCLRCQQPHQGDQGQFQYCKSSKAARRRDIRGSQAAENSPILGSESYFVCDRCARRFLYNEMLQQLVMVLAYPIYLYVIIPLFAENGIFANFLIETLLLVLSLAGGISAYELYRAVSVGKTPLTEARDRVAINRRRLVLGKKFSYTTQFGASQQENKNRN